MKFGDVPNDDARGSILAHTIKLSSGNLKKGVTPGCMEFEQLCEYMF